MGMKENTKQYDTLTNCEFIDDQIRLCTSFDQVNNISFKFTNNKFGAICQNIITFDTEASSGFYDKEKQVVRGFSHGNANRYLHDLVHRYILVSITYVWMCAIEDASDGRIYVFIGRTEEEYWEFIMKLNTEIRLQSGVRKKKNCKYFTYVHNLSYDFGNFLRNVFGDEHFSVFARSERKPIKAHIKMHGVTIDYRCTLFLTQKSLEDWCKDEELTVSKLKVSENFYLAVRTPLTPIFNGPDGDTMKEYCVADVVSMVYGMEKYRTKYYTLENIPMTATGEIRRRVREMAAQNPDYALRCYVLAESYSHELICQLMKCFQGGWTHANATYVNRLIKPLDGYFLTGFDFSSSYPACLCSGKFPVSVFTTEDPNDFDKFEALDPNHADKCWFAKLRITKVDSKLQNSYWSFSKVEDEKELGEVANNKIDDIGYANAECVLDNGRIRKCKAMTAWMTNLDWDTFKKCYYFDDVECLTLYSADYDYLDKPLIDLILDAYVDKTALKGIKDAKSKYRLQKVFINSVYGMMVTKILCPMIHFGVFDEVDEDGNLVYDEDGNIVQKIGWNKVDATEEDYEKLLSKMKPETAITAYAWGVWCTAHARWRLFNGAIIPLDEHICYCDTDSAKGLFTKEDIDKIKQFNDWVVNECKLCANARGIDIDKYSPKTIEGVPKPLGIFDLDGKPLADGFSIYKEFKTLGAKRYAYEDIDGVHTTIAGLPTEAGKKVIKKVDDLSNKCVWNTKQSKKKCHYYNDSQPTCKWVDCNGQVYISHQRYGVAILPTTFDLSIKPEFEAFIKWIGGVNDDNWVKDDYNYEDYA